MIGAAVGRSHSVVLTEGSVSTGYSWREPGLLSLLH